MTPEYTKEKHQIAEGVGNMLHSDEVTQQDWDGLDQAITDLVTLVEAHSAEERMGDLAESFRKGYADGESHAAGERERLEVQARERPATD